MVGAFFMFFPITMIWGNASYINNKKDRQKKCNKIDILEMEGEMSR